MLSRSKSMVEKKNKNEAIQQVTRANSMREQHYPSPMLALSAYIATRNLYKSAIKLDPNNIDSYVGLSIFYSNNFQFEKAVRCLDDALKIVPMDANIHCKKIILLEQMGDIPKALLACEQAIFSHPPKSNSFQVDFMRLAENTNDFQKYMHEKGKKHRETIKLIHQNKMKLAKDISRLKLFGQDRKDKNLCELVADYQQTLTMT